MTKVTYNENLQHTTEAEFRSWAKNLSDALVASGLIKTADTGATVNIDWTNPLVGPGSFADDFTRANGAIANGWNTALGTTTATVDTNKARLVAGASGAFIQKSAGTVYNGTLSAKITSIDQAPGLYFRGRATFTGGGYRWQPTLGTVVRLTDAAITAASTVLTHTAFTPASTDVLSVVMDDSLIVVKRNGVEVGRFSDATFGTTTYAAHGLYEAPSATTGSTFDDFQFSAALRPTTSGIFSVTEMYRFNDSLQSTRPYFIKVQYGTGNTAGYPAINVLVGVGTDGAGGLVGLNMTIGSAATRGPNLLNAAQTWLTHREGYFFLAWGARASFSQPSALHYFVLARPCDDAGACTNEGLSWVAGGATPNSSGTSGNFLQSPYQNQQTNSVQPSCVLPSGVAQTAAGLDIQVFRHFFDAGRVRNNVGVLAYIDNEIPPLSQFQVAVVGGVNRNYMALGSINNWPNSGVGQYGSDALYSPRSALAVMWED